MSDYQNIPGQFAENDTGQSNLNEEKIIAICTYCDKLNSIPRNFSGGKSKCLACGTYLPNPRRKEELEAYQQISRGIVGLLIFAIIMFVPVAYEFFDLALTENEEEVNDNQLEIEYAHPSCEPGENYDRVTCEKEIKWDRIMDAGIHALVLMIPVYGFAEMAIGISKLSKIKTTSF